MRNRQAQYIPAASSRLGIINPIDTSMAYMANQRQRTDLFVAPFERVSGLMGQAVEFNHEMSMLELEYQHLVDNMAAAASSYQGGANAFLTSTNTETARQRNDFIRRAGELNAKRDIMLAAKATLESNKKNLNEDIQNNDPSNVALTARGAVVNTNEGVFNISIGELLGLTSYTNPNRKNVNSKSLSTVSSHIEEQNNNLPAFFRDSRNNTIGVQGYEKLVKVDTTESQKRFNDLFAKVGETSIITGSKKAGRIGETFAGITITDEFRANLMQLRSSIEGIIEGEKGTGDSDMLNFTFNEYVKYLNNGGKIPLMTLEAAIPKQEGVKITGQEQFDVKYVMEEGKIVYDRPGHISLEGYMSFVLSKAVRTANPQINLLSLEKEHYTTQAAGTPKTPTEALGETDSYITGLHPYEPHSMPTTMKTFLSESIAGATRKMLNESMLKKISTLPGGGELVISINNRLDEIAGIQKRYIDTNEQFKKLNVEERKATADANRKTMETMRVDVFRKIHSIYTDIKKSIDEGLKKYNADNDKRKTLEAAKENLPRIWNSLVFGKNTLNVNPAEKVKAISNWLPFRSDQALHAGSAVSEIYLVNGVPLSDVRGVGLLIMNNSYSHNAPLFYATYDIDRDGKRTPMLLADAQNNDEINAFWVNLTQASTQMTGPALMQTIAVSGSNMSSLLKGKTLYVYDAMNERRELTWDKIKTIFEGETKNEIDMQDRIIDQLGITNKLDKTRVSSEGLRKAFRETDGEFIIPENTFFVTGINYNLTNLPQTGGAVRAVSTHIQTPGQ